jgi:hypothetical protein
VVQRLEGIVRLGQYIVPASAGTRIDVLHRRVIPIGSRGPRTGEVNSSLRYLLPPLLASLNIQPFRKIMSHAFFLRRNRGKDFNSINAFLFAHASKIS